MPRYPWTTSAPPSARRWSLPAVPRSWSDLDVPTFSSKVTEGSPSPSPSPPQADAAASGAVPRGMVGFEG
jgi:hypothetical protein